MDHPRRGRRPGSPRSGVSPEGRISPGDTGLWNDAQASAFARITNFIVARDAVPGIQLAHAGRKASTQVPWKGGRPLAANEGAWTTLGPSAIPFDESFPPPREMTADDLGRLGYSESDLANLKQAGVI